MNKYELSLVLDAKLTPAKKKAVIEKITKKVESLKGKVGEVKDFGEKRYGIVVMFPLELTTEAAKNITQKISLEEDVKKSLFIKL